MGKRVAVRWEDEVVDSFAYLLSFAHTSRDVRETETVYVHRWSLVFVQCSGNMVRYSLFDEAIFVHHFSCVKSFATWSLTWCCLTSLQADRVDLVKVHYCHPYQVIAQRFAFNNWVQQEGESMADFMAGPLRLSEHCQLTGSLDNMVRDRLVCGIHNGSLPWLAEPDLMSCKAFWAVPGLGAGWEFQSHHPWYTKLHTVSSENLYATDMKLLSKAQL